MAITMNQDPNTGVQLDGLYYRIDKMNFNDFDFQVVMTGYASKEAHDQKALPMAQPRAYTWEYSKADLLDVNIFEYAYKKIKEHEDFKDAEDVLEEGQEPTT